MLDDATGRREGRQRKRTHLENLFRILPAGVTSKKDIGDLNMAVAILSCNFLDAYKASSIIIFRRLIQQVKHTSMEQKIHNINV